MMPDADSFSGRTLYASKWMKDPNLAFNLVSAVQAEMNTAGDPGFRGSQQSGLWNMDWIGYNLGLIVYFIANNFSFANDNNQLVTCFRQAKVGSKALNFLNKSCIQLLTDFHVISFFFLLPVTCSYGYVVMRRSCLISPIESC